MGGLGGAIFFHVTCMSNGSSGRLLCVPWCGSVAMARRRHAAAAWSQGVHRYRLLDEGTGLGAVAKGSFGRVYVAIDTRTGITVAVKRQQVPCRVAVTALAFYEVLSRLLFQFLGTGRQKLLCVHGL